MRLVNRWATVKVNLRVGTFVWLVDDGKSNCQCARRRKLDWSRTAASAAFDARLTDCPMND